jgi:glycosyltransferase involved in cell wall biosynthesis
LAVVIAAYNEEDGIEAVLRRIPTEVLGLGADTIVVVDGATDRTADAARQAGVMVCSVPVNRGQGAALRLGYRLARERGARYIATLDADGQYDPVELDAVVAPLLEGWADMVTGSRRLGASHTTDRARAAGVVVFGALITVLTRTRITDPANGLRAMRAEVTATVTLEQPQYQASELLVGAILSGYRVVEVPVTMHVRSAGTTKKGGNLLYGLRFCRVVVGTWWRDRQRAGLRDGSAKITSS